MQIAAEVSNSPSVAGGEMPDVNTESHNSSAYSDYKIIRRNGAVVGFEPVNDFRQCRTPARKG